MTYNPGIPNANQLISASQQPIKDNFGQLNAQFGIDHNPFNTGSGNGDGHHKQVFFDVAAASNTPPLPTIPSGAANSVMYSAPDATSTNQEMFWANKQFNGGAAVQMTNSNLAAASGQGMMPGGLQLRTGGPISLTADNVAHTFTISGGGFPSAIVTAFAWPTNADITHAIQYDPGSSTKTLAAFASNNGGSFNISYLAIGY